MKNRYHYETPIGMVCIEEDGEAITALYLDEIKEEDRKKEIESDLTRRAHSELDEYFMKKRTQFDLPIKLEGTEFQKRVWNALRQIPYGKTSSYKEIATMIENPKACRAVGGANNKNPIIIVVPCHRVIGTNGSLVGFAGGLDTKEYLLNLEK